MCRDVMSIRAIFYEHGHDIKFSSNSALVVTAHAYNGNSFVDGMKASDTLV